MNNHVLHVPELINLDKPSELFKSAKDSERATLERASMDVSNLIICQIKKKIIKMMYLNFFFF